MNNRDIQIVIAIMVVTVSSAMLASELVASMLEPLNKVLN